MKEENENVVRFNAKVISSDLTPQDIDMAT